MILGFESSFLEWNLNLRSVKAKKNYDINTKHTNVIKILLINNFFTPPTALISKWINNEHNCEEASSKGKKSLRRDDNQLCGIHQLAFIIKIKLLLRNLFCFEWKLIRKTISTSARHQKATRSRNDLKCTNGMFF